MLSLVILLSLLFCAFVYLIAQTHTAIHAEQLKSIEESMTLREFLTRRVPVLFIPILVVLPSIIFGVCEIINSDKSPATYMVLFMGLIIAATMGKDLKARADTLQSEE